jgi:thiol:disulfide interchange protein
MRPRKVLTLVFLVSVLGVGYLSMHSAPVQSDASRSYHGDTAWHTNVTAAQQLSERRGDPLLVYFWTTWCSYCEDYDEKVYSDPAVREALDGFVLLAVNLDADGPAIDRLKGRYEATYPPQHVAVSPSGERLLTLRGYAEREAFLSALREAQRNADGTAARGRAGAAGR